MSAGPSGGGLNIDYTREDVDYDSTNEEDEDTRQAKKARRDLAEKPRTDKKSKAKVICLSLQLLFHVWLFKEGISVFNTEVSAEEGRRQRFQLSKLNAYDRHKQLINTYHVSLNPCIHFIK